MFSNNPFADLTVFLSPFVMQGFNVLMILTVAIGVVLGSLARAVDARLGYCWGWLYGEHRSSTWLDRSVDGILRRLIAVQIHHSSTDAPPPACWTTTPGSKYSLLIWSGTEVTTHAARGQGEGAGERSRTHVLSLGS